MSNIQRTSIKRQTLNLTFGSALLLALLFNTGCDDGDDPSTTCTPGATLDCSCDDGSSGVMRCDESGESWGPCGECEGDGECTPGDEQDCDCADGSNGTMTCNDDGTAWSDCQGCGSTGDCEPGETRGCDCADGSSGTETCNDSGTGWSACEDCGSTGDCESGESRACTCSDGAEGTQTCSSDEEWGECLCDALCTDADGDGYPAESGCEQERDCNDDDASVHPGAEEVCDGVDNDCDGSIDPGCACDDGDTQPCGETDEGECAYGTQTCSSGTWGLCTGAVGPSTEVCDGLDNDCDGSTDEDIATMGTSCLVPDTLGVCAVGELECSGGVERCAQVVTATEETCNALDDDCNGSTDEGNPGGGGDCTVSGTFGPCQEGSLVCSSGELVCNQTVFPTSETCDGVDEDCDGTVDNRPPPAEPCACEDGDTVACGSDVGECVSGTDVCTEGAYSGCGGTYVGPATEICDGLDNDCDGTPDNGDPGGGGACTISGAHGPCAAGVRHCVGGELICQQVVSPASETCNDIDDDCDGSVDEGNPGGGGSCFVSGLHGPCANGVEQCSGGELLCEQTVYPGSETDPASHICNSIDDDCDGSVDEACGDCTPGAVRSCGVTDRGECSYGTETCDATGNWGDCIGAVGPTDEICDGRDNDCDGITDDGDPGGGEGCRALALGECSFGTTRCHGGHIVCDAGMPVAETCNGLDDDCDGETDESGSWPEADFYEFNNDILTAVSLESFTSLSETLSPDFDMNFHTTSDRDCFFWTYPLPLSVTPRFWQCRPTGLSSEQEVSFWLGVGSNRVPHLADIASNDYTNIENAEAASLGFAVAGSSNSPPFEFFICVDQEEGWGPCFAEYDIECKINTVSTW